MIPFAGLEYIFTIAVTLYKASSINFCTKPEDEATVAVLGWKGTV